MSDDRFNKMPILIEIIGEGGVGKTTLGAQFPNSVIFDFTAEGESKLNAMLMYGEEWNSRYFHCLSYNDYLNALTGVRDFAWSVVIDTSKDFVNFLAQRWLDEENQIRRRNKEPLLKRVYPPTRFGEINRNVDSEIRKMMSIPANVIMISGMADEYINDKRTGKRRRDGYSQLPFSAWLRIAIEIIDNDRVYKIIKNRFVDRLSDNYVHAIKMSEVSDVIAEIRKATFENPAAKGVPASMALF